MQALISILTPRQRNELHAAIEKHGLVGQDFEITINSSEARVNHRETSFYFIFSSYLTLPPSLANAIVVALHPFYVEHKPDFRNQLNAASSAKLGTKSWEDAYGYFDKWLAWIKREYGPFKEGNLLPNKDNTQPARVPMNEEFIKKQAADSVEVAFRFSIHHEIDKCSDTIISRAERIYKPEDKVLYFEEAISLIHAKILEHRSTCKHGAGCYTEKQYEQIIYFLQQELDIIPKPVESGKSLPESFPNTSIQKIFISHSSRDSDIVEEIIDLLEIIGVNSEQIFCSSFAGYSTNLGQDFLQRIKDELNGNVLVIFVLTDSFYKSPISLCEMGAAWVRTSQHIPIIVPPLSYDDVKGVITHTHGFRVNEPLKWNLLKEQVEQWFAISTKASASVWERKRDKAIRTIEGKIDRAKLSEREKSPASVSPAKPKRRIRGV